MPRLFVLVLAWFAWSGHYTYSLEHPLIAVFGVCSCLGVWLLARRMDGSHLYRRQTVLGPGVLLYLGWLFLEIVKSSLAVAKIIVSPDMPINPRVIKIEATQIGENARVLHANSITLTPGTITLDVRGKHFYVHAIDRAAAEGVESGEMDRVVTKLEKT